MACPTIYGGSALLTTFRKVKRVLASTRKIPDLYLRRPNRGTRLGRAFGSVGVAPTRRRALGACADVDGCQARMPAPPATLGGRTGAPTVNRENPTSFASRAYESRLGVWRT